MGRRKSGIQTQRGRESNRKYSKGCREASFHPSVPSPIRPSIQSSIHLVMVCLLWQGEKRMEYRRDTTEKAIGRDGTHAKALHWWEDGWNDASLSFGHPSVLSWFVYSNRVEKEWNTHIYNELKINNIFSGCHQIRNKIK